MRQEAWKPKDNKLERNLPAIERSALLVLDWQTFFVSPDSPAFIPSAPLAEPNLIALVEAFLAAGRPVFATRHAHTSEDHGAFERFYGRVIRKEDPLSELAPFLKERRGIRFLVKRTYSAFASTRLAGDFRSLGVRTLVIAGTQTDKCVVANALAAFDLGFDVLVATDACAARSEERHREALRLIERSCAVLASSRDLCSGARKAGTRVPDSRPRAFDAELLIAGAGPAGLAAFIQARREGLNPIVVEPSAPGGALRAGRRIENFPGTGACPGPALADRMARHAEAAGLTVLRDRVVSLREGGGWRVSLASGRFLRCRAVILAVGQEPVVPESLAPLRDAGMLLIPGAFDPEKWRGKLLLVIGGGDAAFDQALLLLDHGASPEIICRSEPRALPVLRAEAEERGIRIKAHLVPLSSSAGPRPQVTFSGGASSSPVTLEADAVLVAVGKRPSPPEAEGYDGERLDWPALTPGVALPAGLFLAGDVWRGDLRQAAVAAGDGCAAAIAASRYLRDAAAGDPT